MRTARDRVDERPSGITTQTTSGICPANREPSRPSDEPPHEADADDRTLRASISMDVFDEDTDSTIAFSGEWLDHLAATARRSDPPPDFVTLAAPRVPEVEESPLSGVDAPPPPIADATDESPPSDLALPAPAPVTAVEPAHPRRRRTLLLLAVAGFAYFFVKAALVWSVLSATGITPR